MGSSEMVEGEEEEEEEPAEEDEDNYWEILGLWRICTEPEQWPHVGSDQSTNTITGLWNLSFSTRIFINRVMSDLNYQLKRVSSIFLCFLSLALVLPVFCYENWDGFFSINLKSNDQYF